VERAKICRAVPPIRISCWKPRHFCSKLEMCELSQPIWKIKVAVLLGSAQSFNIIIIKTFNSSFLFHFPNSSWNMLVFALFRVVIFFSPDTGKLSGIN
jgi:hypothetical protein